MIEVVYRVVVTIPDEVANPGGDVEDRPEYERAVLRATEDASAVDEYRVTGRQIVADFHSMAQARSGERRLLRIKNGDLS